MKAWRRGARGTQGRLEVVLREVSDWIAVLDESLRITFSTAASQRVVGLPPDELLGRPLTDLVAEAESVLQSMLREAARSEDAVVALNVRDGDGWRRTIFGVSDLRLDPAVAGWVVIGRDDRVAQALRDELLAVRSMDSLTGLANRAESMRELTVRLARMGSGAPRPVVLVVDVDGFWEVNRREGQDVGDAVLRRLAAGIESWVPDGGHVARTGDDEFVVLVDDDRRSSAGRLAEDLHRRVSGTVRVGDRVVPMTATVVARRAATAERDPWLLMQDASEAVRALKLAGGDAASEAFVETTIDLRRD